MSSISVVVGEDFLKYKTEVSILILKGPKVMSLSIIFRSYMYHNFKTRGIVYKKLSVVK